MKKNTLAKLIATNWQIILASCIFLTYQLLVSYILWDRKSDIPPGFGDSLSYIFNIEKVIKNHNLFPQIPYFGASKIQLAHFTYIGYNFLMGILGISLNMTGEKIFFYSFFFGKVALLFGCIFLLKKILNNQKNLIALSLIALGFFVGDGGIHGFYWVTPSFWMLIIFFLLMGIINSEKKINFLFLVPLSLLYITIHPLSIFSIFIFFAYTIFIFLFTKKIPQKSITVTITLVILAIFWQIFIYSISNLNKHTQASVLPPPKKTLDQTIKQVKDNSDIAQNNSVLYIATNIKKDDVVQKVTNSAPSIPQITIFDKLIENNTNSIPNTSSFIAAWNSYFSWFFRLPFLLVLLLGGLFIFIKKKKWSLVSLYLSCLLFTLVSLINPMGYRSILFLFPITIIFLVTATFDLIAFAYEQKYKIAKIPLWFLYFIIALSLIGYAIFGLKTVKYYSTIASYKINPSQCVEYIKKFEPQKTQIYFTSVEGINYFLNQGIENYAVTGINYFDDKHPQDKTLLITEDYNKINKTDIDIPLFTSSDLLLKVKNNLNKITHVDCDIFQLFDITNSIR